MKKFTPYVVVGVVLLIAVVAWRWHDLRRAQPEISPEGISIEDLTETEQSNLLKGVDDYQEVELSPVNIDQYGPATGSVRYLVEDGRLKFSVITSLPSQSGTSYTVWLHPLNLAKLERVTVLEPKKGGMLGSASVPANILPAEVIISPTNNPTEVLKQALLKAVIHALPEEN